MRRNDRKYGGNSILACNKHSASTAQNPQSLQRRNSRLVNMSSCVVIVVVVYCNNNNNNITIRE